MRTLSLIALYCFSCMSLQAQWKVATANMKDLFNSHPETAKYDQEAKAKIALIEQDARAISVKNKTNELKALDGEGQNLVLNYNKLTTDEEKKPESEKIRNLLEKRRITEQELASLRQEFQEFKKQQMLDINKASAKRMREILAEITALITQHAIAQGFDAVYDVSGYTNTGLQAVVYVKPGVTTDITPVIKKIITPEEKKAEQ